MKTGLRNVSLLDGTSRLRVPTCRGAHSFADVMPPIANLAVCCLLEMMACLSLCGCGPSTENNPFSQELTDKSGTNRLALLYVPVGFRIGREGHYEFHSLVLNTKVGSKWMKRLSISRTAFQAGTSRRRWVSEIASFDAGTGIAIIKVAEADAPMNAASISYAYSWREWNLFSNEEVRLLRICEDPLERY